MGVASVNLELWIWHCFSRMNRWNQLIFCKLVEIQFIFLGGEGGGGGGGGGVGGGYGKWMWLIYKPDADL